MIVNLKNTEKLSLLKGLYRWAKMILNHWNQYYEHKRIDRDAHKLKSHFLFRYPMLKKDQLDNTLCISCNLCQEICPPQAIDIKKPNMINFPKSLKTGEAPHKFFLDLTKCTKCNLCALACPVDALELTEQYKGSKKVDLVQRLRS